MTDDEARAWLSAVERDLFAGAIGRDTEPDVVAGVRQAMRALAETRKALDGAAVTYQYQLVDGDCYEHCGVCGADDDHEPGCLFTTMPRPK